MRTEVVNQAVEFLATKGNLKDQIKFLEDKGLSPKEIYYAMLKAGVYIPLKYNYFTSLLLGGGLIFAASKAIEYTLGVLIKPIHESMDNHISTMNKSVDKMQSELGLMSNDVNDAVVKINATVVGNNTQMNELLLDFERLETNVKDTTTQQEIIMADLIKEVNHLKSLLSSKTPKEGKESDKE